MQNYPVHSNLNGHAKKELSPKFQNMCICGTDPALEIPFLDRMGFVFVLAMIGMILISKYEVSRGVKTNGLEIDRSMFKVSNGFAVGALMILGTLAALYTIFW